MAKNSNYINLKKLLKIGAFGYHLEKNSQEPAQ